MIDYMIVYLQNFFEQMKTVEAGFKLFLRHKVLIGVISYVLVMLHVGISRQMTKMI